MNYVPTDTYGRHTKMLANQLPNSNDIVVYRKAVATFTARSRARMTRPTTSGKSLSIVTTGLPQTNGKEPDLLQAADALARAEDDDFEMTPELERAAKELENALMDAGDEFEALKRSNDNEDEEQEEENDESDVDISDIF